MLCDHFRGIIARRCPLIHLYDDTAFRFEEFLTLITSRKRVPTFDTRQFKLKKGYRTLASYAYAYADLQSGPGVLLFVD